MSRFANDHPEYFEPATLAMQEAMARQLKAQMQALTERVNKLHETMALILRHNLDTVDELSAVRDRLRDRTNNTGVAAD